MSQNMLDYNIGHEFKLYYKAIAALSTKFDLQPANMRAFIQAFFDKAGDVNWMMTLAVPVGNALVDLVTQYGSVSIEDVRAHALTYINVPSRHYQNSNQIYACLSESLTPEAKNRVALERQRFTVLGTSDGLLYFKVIVGLASIDTRATVSNIRTSLSSLDIKLAELQDDIVELNRFVKTQMEGLAARGEVTEDLLVNLFKAYKSCGDHGFTAWVHRKEDDYNEGHTNLTTMELMTLADDKYKLLVETGRWMVKSTAQKRIVALTAQVQQALARTSINKKPEAKKTLNSGSKNGYKGKNKPNDRKSKDKDWAWTLVAPTNGQPKEKDVGGKHFRWCIHHNENGSGGKWVQHSLADCKVRKDIEAKKGSTKPSDAGQSQMKVAGMVAVLPEDDDY